MNQKYTELNGYHRRGQQSIAVTLSGLVSTFTRVTGKSGKNRNAGRGTGAALFILKSS